MKKCLKTLNVILVPILMLVHPSAMLVGCGLQDRDGTCPAEAPTQEDASATFEELPESLRARDSDGISAVLLEFEWRSDALAASNPSLIKSAHATEPCTISDVVTGQSSLTVSWISREGSAPLVFKEVEFSAARLLSSVTGQRAGEYLTSELLLATSDDSLWTLQIQRSNGGQFDVSLVWWKVPPLRSELDEPTPARAWMSIQGGEVEFFDVAGAPML